MHFEVYQDKTGDWRWRLVAINGRVIADSAEGYERAIDCEHGIKLIREGAINARVDRV